MTDNPLFSPGSAAMILAMTALQCARGVPSAEALERAHAEWRDHDRASWEFSDLRAVVDKLTR